MSPTIHGRIDPLSGRFTSYADEASRSAAEPVDRIVWADRDAAAHEARHVAVGLLRASE